MTTSQNAFCLKLANKTKNVKLKEKLYALTYIQTTFN